MADLAAWLALNLADALGPTTIRRLVEQFSSPEAILTAAQDGRLAGLRDQQVASLARWADRLSQVEEMILQLKEELVDILTWDDEPYPANLRACPDAPPVLYVQGSLSPEDGRAVALVGTRSPTQEGEQLAHQLAWALAGRGVCVVSGLAPGVDTAAHVGALDAGGRTIAVLGGGILRIRPRDNQGLAGQIAHRGAVLSEAPPFVLPTTRRLMQRNRIQAGLALGVIVVEAWEKGGSLETARKCREYGRHLFAVRYARKQRPALGNEALIWQGATPIHGAQDVDLVLERLSRPAAPAGPAQKRLDLPPALASEDD